MKKIIYGLAVLFILCSCASQSGLKNETITSKRILYRSALNVIELDSTLKDVDVSITNGQVFKHGRNTFEIVVDSSYETSLLIKQKGKTQKIDFRVVTMPKLELRLSARGKRIGPTEATVEEFKELSSITTMLQNFTVDCIFNIVHITVVRIRDGKKEVFELDHPSNGYFGRLTNDAKRGDAYIFKDIQAEIQQTKRIIPGQEVTLFLQ